jgi:hypothetical protein
VTGLSTSSRVTIGSTNRKEEVFPCLPQLPTFKFILIFIEKRLGMSNVSVENARRGEWPSRRVSPCFCWGTRVWDLGLMDSETNTLMTPKHTIDKAALETERKRWQDFAGRGRGTKGADIEASRGETVQPQATLIGSRHTHPLLVDTFADNHPFPARPQHKNPASSSHYLPWVDEPRKHRYVQDCCTHRCSRLVE